MCANEAAMHTGSVWTVLLPV